MNDIFNIQKVSFDFGMESEEMAFKLNSTWHSFYQKSFAAIADKVFQKYNRKKHHLLINQMILDLGEIKSDDFYSKFPELLAQKLEELLSEYLLAPNDKYWVRKLTHNQIKFEAFAFFLIHGFFPWPSQNENQNIHELFYNVYSFNPVELCNFLFDQSTSAQLRKRIVYQLNDQELEQLIELLNKKESDFVIEYTRLLINERTYPNKLAVRLSDHRNLVWNFIFSYLLMNRDSSFNRKEFTRHTIGEIARHYNLKYTQLLHFLISVLNKSETCYLLKHELESILMNLNMEQQNEQNNVSDEIEIIQLQRILQARSKETELPVYLKDKIEKDQSFRKKIMKEFELEQIIWLFEMINNSNTPVIFKQIYETEISEYIQEKSNEFVEKQVLKLNEFNDKNGLPKYLREEYLSFLKQPLSRRKFIKRLNENQLVELVKLIEPDEATFIISYSKALDQQHERNFLEGKAGGEFRQLKWEFIFSVLIEDHIPQFNRKAFVLSVITMLVAHYSIDLLNLLSFIYKGILANEYPLPEYMVEIIKELYFESKERKHKNQEIDLFNKEIQETYYANLLLNYIQTGYVNDQNFEGKIYSAFQYLQTYRPDLLKLTIEKLKRGFVVTSIHQIPNAKNLFRELTLFVIETYQINLPDRRNLKSFLSDLTDESYHITSLKALKILLLAILKNDYKLYKIAWECLTIRLDKNEISPATEISFLSDELVLKIISQVNKSGFREFMLRRKESIIKRLSISKELFYNFTTLCNNQPHVSDILSETWGNDFYVEIKQTISQFFSLQKEQTDFIFQLLDLPIFHENGKIKLQTIFFYTTVLFSGKENEVKLLIGKLINLFPETRKEDILNEISKFTQSAKISNFLQTKVFQALKSFFKEKQKPKPAKYHQPESNEYILKWLTEQFGLRTTIGDPIFGRDGEHNREYIFLQFEELLIHHPELLQKLIEDGVISAERMTQWIKTAPASVRMRWMQFNALPYNRIAIHEAFTLLNWMRQYFNAHKLNLPEDKIIDLLVDFSSGKYKNKTQQELMVMIVKQGLKNIETTAVDPFFNYLQQLAAQKGINWGQKITTIQQKIEQDNKNNTDTQLNEPIKDLPTKKTPKMENEFIESLFIKNAGLILCSPYLPRLYSILNLTSENQFLEEANRERAALLLQYLLFQDTDYPEYELVLNKILCGFPIETPINTVIEVENIEKKTLESLLENMIANWPVLKNTSTSGLRESFLIRNGILKEEEDAWYLTVEQKGFDVLLDQLPWSYTPVKHHWMNKPIHVKWR